MKSNYFGIYDAKGFARWIKGAKRLICATEDDKIILLDGFAAYLLTGEDYENIARPVVKLAPGNWTIENGEPRELPPGDFQKFYNLFKISHADDCIIANTGVFFKTEDAKKTPVLYYNTARAFASAFDTKFLESLRPEYTHKMLQEKATGAAGVVVDDFITAIILPIRIDSKYNAIARAAVDPEGAPAEVDTLQKERERLENELLKLEHENTTQAGYIKELEARKNAPAVDNSAEVDALKQKHAEELKAAEAARLAVIEKLATMTEEAAAAKAAQADAEKAAEEARAEAAELAAKLEEAQKHAATEAEPENVKNARARFENIPGAVVVVKGARTACPVVWISATEDAAAAVVAAGGTYSSKRGAYWYKAA